MFRGFLIFFSHCFSSLRVLENIDLSRASVNRDAGKSFLYSQCTINMTRLETLGGIPFCKKESSRKIESLQASANMRIYYLCNT